MVSQDMYKSLRNNSNLVLYWEIQCNSVSILFQPENLLQALELLLIQARLFNRITDLYHYILGQVNKVDDYQETHYTGVDRG